QPCRKEVLPCSGRFPGEQGPGHTMYWASPLVEMQQWQSSIEVYFSACRTIAQAIETIGPRMEERNSCRTPIPHAAIEVLHAPEQTYAPMTKRGAEPHLAWKKNRLKIDRNESMSGWVIDQTWRSRDRRCHSSDSLFRRTF